MHSFAFGGSVAGHPHGDDDAELMARRAADWLTAEELAMSEEEAARQMEELDRSVTLSTPAPTPTSTQTSQGHVLHGTTFH